MDMIITKDMNYLCLSSRYATSATVFEVASAVNIKFPIQERVHADTMCGL